MRGHFDSGNLPELPEWAEPVPAGASPALKPVDRPKEKAKLDLGPKSGSAVEHFREQCREAGIVDDKPLFQVLMTIFVAAETALATVQTGARGLTPEGEADLVSRIVKTVDASVKASTTKHRLRLERKASWIAGGVVVASFLLGGASTYWWAWTSGRQSVQVTEQRIQAAFRSGPDAAALWVELMMNNDPVSALAQCTGSAAWQVNGRLACRMPLWLNAGPAPEAK